jgi:hypothetical protein
VRKGADTGGHPTVPPARPDRGGAATISLPHGSARVALDGEQVELDGPLEFRCEPNALEVLVPPDGDR